jgi:micrococcal nuclease
MISPNYIYKAFVKNVIDGDTIDAEIDLGFNIKIIHRLRLNRINTFETRGTSGETKSLALAGKEFTKTKLLNKEIIIKTQKSDAFGRYLAEVWYFEGENQINICDELLSLNLAILYEKK